MNYITVDTGKESYPIYFEESFDSLSSAAEKCGCKGKKLCIISDSNVAPLYAENVKSELEKVFSEVYVCTFTAGEKSKNLDTIKSFYDFVHGQTSPFSEKVLRRASIES